MLKRGLHRLIRVYTCQNATLLEIACHGSNFYLFQVIRMIDFNKTELQYYFSLRQFWPKKKCSFFMHSATLYIHPRLDSRIEPNVLI